jgi:predicted ATPase/DNA-binding winged helix-turn-helix (wHTH) protein
MNVKPRKGRPTSITSGFAISFGPFQLFPTQRRLEKDGVQLRIGGRALDILIVLAGRRPEIVEKRELLAEVWPNGAIDEGTLRFHLNGLRKVLGNSGKDGPYIVNVPGRGYCFVAPIAYEEIPSYRAPSLWPLTTAPLPPPALRLLGRDEDARAISANVVFNRFVSIVGPGGVGKTTIAVSVAHELLHDFEGSVCFVDLSRMHDPSLVLGSVAASIGLSVMSQHALPDLITYLRNRRMILVFDSCEHVIDPVAELVEGCFVGAQSIYIIATSREPLRASGEHVYRLPPLGYPPEGCALSAASAGLYPAVEYFVKCMNDSGTSMDLDDLNANRIGEICRRLDGNPLAIELTAPRVGAFGIGGLTQLLEGQFGLNWCGRRTASPRHRTLRSTLDWSYNLLNDQDRKVHHRLSVFVGPFQLDAAQAVAADDDTDLKQVVNSISNLITKSLISIENNESIVLYRIHEVTRAYANEKLCVAGEHAIASRKHAMFYHERLKMFRHDSINPGIVAAKPAMRSYVANVRAALEWAFSPKGDAKVAIELAAASGPLFLATSNLLECRLWCERGIAALKTSACAGHLELELRTSLALSRMFTTGNGDEVRVSLEDALTLAEKGRDLYQQLRLHACLVIYMIRIGNFDAAVGLAHRSELVAGELQDLEGLKSADWLLCISHHCVGNHVLAQVHGERALRYPAGTNSEPWAQPRYDTRILALTALARTLWIRREGYRAITVARQLVEEAAAIMHPVSLCVALSCVVTICVWEGELEIAEDITEDVKALADKYLLAPYQALASGLQAQIVLKRGDTQAGVELMQTWLATLPAHRQLILAGEFKSTLAEGLGRIGRLAEGQTLIDDEIARICDPEHSYAGPELLRIKGELLGIASDEASEIAEDLLKRAVLCARRQSAAAWELRAAISLSSFYRAQGRIAEGDAILASVDHRRDAWAGSPDFAVAARKLRDLSRVVSSRALSFHR